MSSEADGGTDSTDPAPHSDTDQQLDGQRDKQTALPFVSKDNRSLSLSGMAWLLHFLKKLP